MSLLLEWLIEGTVLAALATLVARFIPPRYAAQRHAFWWLTLVSLAMLPALSAVSRRGPAVPVAESRTAGDVLGALDRNQGVETTGLTGLAAFEPIVVPPVPEAVGLAAGAIWLAFALVSLVRLAGGLGAVQRIARDARPIDSMLDDRLRRRLREGRHSRPVSVVASDRLAGACAVGFRHPRIVVSSSLVRQGDRQVLEAIVLHEYAHLARFDDWTRLFQRVLLIVIGLHPAARWISRQIDAECEAACDRFVLDRRVAPGVYARALASAAEIALAGPRFPSRAVPAAFVPGAALHQRVARVLSDSRVGPRTARRASVCGAGAVALTVAVAAAGPPVVVTDSTETWAVELSDRPEAFSGAARFLAAVDARAPHPALSAPMNVNDAIIIASSAPASSSGEMPGSAQMPARAQTSSSARMLSVTQAASPSPTAPSPTAPIPSSGASDPAASAGVESPDVAPAPPASMPLASMPPASIPLASTPLAHAPQVPGVALGGEHPDSELGVAALGDSAASAGAATGAAAARAGNAIGRAFRKGGLAIANRF